MVPTIGRPRLDVDIEEILELRKLHFKWTKIAEIIGISRSTLYRRFEQAGISPVDHTPLLDQEIDEIICSIKRNHPNDGEVLLQGRLLDMGIRITRQALRASIHRVDHESVVDRQRHVVRRRVYSVPHPNALWHMDGNHKLIRWRLVIHGMIDGFSRTVIYLKCADNNRSSTVLDFFLDGISQFGIPDCVRSDHGGENVGIWRYMILTHNGDFSSVVTGSSVHNERVERLWRDVHRCVLSTFSDVFRTLEREGVLDAVNEVDLFCLHYVFLPRIDRSLTEFRDSWNNHALSSEGSRTPYQLLFEGLHHVLSHSDYSLPSADDTAIDVDVSQLTGNHVHFPRVSFTPCDGLLQDLSIINPLQSCSDNAISFYSNTIQIAGQHLTTGCNQCSPNE